MHRKSTHTLWHCSTACLTWMKLVFNSTKTLFSCLRNEKRIGYREKLSLDWGVWRISLMSSLFFSSLLKLTYRYEFQKLSSLSSFYFSMKQRTPNPTDEYRSRAKVTGLFQWHCASVVPLVLRLEGKSDLSLFVLLNPFESSWMSSDKTAPQAVCELLKTTLSLSFKIWPSK